MTDEHLAVLKSIRFVLVSAAIIAVAWFVIHSVSEYNRKIDEYHRQCQQAMYVECKK